MSNPSIDPRGPRVISDEFLHNLKTARDLTIKDCIFPMMHLDDFFTDLLSMDVSRNQISYEFLDALVGKSTRLQKLYASSVNLQKIPPSVFATPNLTTLDLSGNSQISEFEVAQLAKLSSITYLNLSSCNVSPVGGVPLSKMPKLRFLDLSLCRGVSTVVADALASSTSLQMLSIAGTQVTTLCSLLQSRSLTYINASSCKLTHEGLEQLDLTTSITQLNLRNISCDRQTIEELLSCSSLTSLDIVGFREISNGLISALASKTQLTEVNLTLDERYLVTSTAIHTLLQSPSLTRLHMFSPSLKKPTLPDTLGSSLSEFSLDNLGNDNEQRLMQHVARVRHSQAQRRSQVYFALLLLASGYEPCARSYWSRFPRELREIILCDWLVTQASGIKRLTTKPIASLIVRFLIQNATEIRQKFAERRGVKILLRYSPTVLPECTFLV